MARTLKEERSWSDNWHGKAKVRVRAMREITWVFISFLQDLDISAAKEDYDFEVDEYVNRIVWSKRDK